MKIKIALADDHVLLRNGLATLLSDHGFNVLFGADNGKDFLEKLKSNSLPDVVLMDINMPRMDGFETCLWLKQNHPTVKVLALSMYDDENAIIRMLKNGARGYVLKDSEPHELKIALEAVHTKGFYHSEIVSGKLIHAINNLDGYENASTKNVLGLTQKEIEFLKLAATEMTYKEIAERMLVSPRTVDGYRDGLIEKLNVKGRVGMVLFAIKSGIVNI